ncbi:hypothetical protein [Solitalea lacus]|uniref:hypothetical protein n=1 Tax=Solitalea lacus TaxID=2911172 RepID=UPI001EDA9131|nr:hypothetical protein [Solitalea lacus]UKJ09065.1 hypothetical protein L2B55_07835 [Solitalea lacus]
MRLLTIWSILAFFLISGIWSCGSREKLKQTSTSDSSYSRKEVNHFFSFDSASVSKNQVNYEREVQEFESFRDADGKVKAVLKNQLKNVFPTQRKTEWSKKAAFRITKAKQRLTFRRKVVLKVNRQILLLVQIFRKV